MDDVTCRQIAEDYVEARKAKKNFAVTGLSRDDIRKVNVWIWELERDLSFPGVFRPPLS